MRPATVKRSVLEPCSERERTDRFIWSVRKTFYLSFSGVSGAYGFRTTGVWSERKKLNDYQRTDRT